MENETNILLSELVEAVEKLNNPDLWSVGATVLAAVVAAVITYVLGKRQNELQKQQLKIQERQNELQEEQTRLQKQQNKLQEQQIRQQEYEIYSRLYKLVKKADVEIDEYLDEITSSLGVIPWKRAEDGFLKLKLDYILELRKELEDNAIDFEIKFTKEFFDLEAYRHLLSSMTLNLRNLVKMVEEKKMIFDGAGAHRIYGVDGDIEKGKAYYIAQHIKDKQYEVAVGSNFLHFIEDRKKLREGGNDILEKIRERCKVE